MATIRVSQMATATEFNDDDYVMIVQSNTNKKITKQNMYKSYIYSGNEIVVGKWFDKPLYRKTIQFQNNINSGTNTEAHLVSDADEIFIDQSHSFMFASNAGLSYPFPINQYNSATNFDRVGVYVDRTNITIVSEGSWGSVWTAYVTILYTKTTD